MEIEGGEAGRLLGLLAALGDLPCVVEGVGPAALLGTAAPVPVIDLVLPGTDAILDSFTRWAARNTRRWDDRRGSYGPGDPDPRSGPDPLRYDTPYGVVRLRLVAELPESVAVEVGGRTVRVLRG